MAKAKKTQRMGRGLGAILNNINVDDIKTADDKGADKLVGSIVEIDINKIEVNPFQPRTHFDENALQELANSIKELGIIQPITVNKLDSGNFQLVSGERRFRASKLVGLKTIPAYIRILNDQAMLEMALVENIQRQDLDPIEIALSYQRLIDEINLTQEELSVRVGKQRSTVTNYLRLLKLNPIIQTGMRDNFISMGHGRALINVESPTDQITIYEKILRDKLSVRQTEVLVKELKDGKFVKNQAKNKKELPLYVTENLDKINSFFGKKINVKVNDKGKGSISIPFDSAEDFNRIKDLLK
ncbi:MAG: ParB/RepB/Spo0J family partition protein [Tenacibaculum sp.]|nr:ParB/RepB/Spo0J family partition protein [Tenacibaculum sp.]